MKHLELGFAHGVATVTLNRPDQMNSINGALSHGLWNAVQQLNGDPGLTAGVLTVAVLSSGTGSSTVPAAGCTEALLVMVPPSARTIP